MERFYAAAGLGFEPRVALIQSQACYHYTTRHLLEPNHVV